MWDRELLDIRYLRLSEEDETCCDGTKAESNSIGSQRRCIQQFLQANPGICDETIEIVDDGFSGTSMERPGMQRLLALVEAHKVRTIIVRDLSRFARNYLEAGHYLEYVFPAYGIRFISINDHFDSQELGESTGGLELAIRNLVNQMYSRDISKKIKSVVDLKKLRGEYAFGAKPYGYRKGEKPNTIVVDEPAAEVVRDIFTWACEGKSITWIAKNLNELGADTPSVYLASIRGRYKVRAFWTYESVRNILQNRIYTGDTEAYKSHVKKVGSKRVNMIPEEQRLLIPDTHEAIITREQYYLAKKAVKATAKKSKPSGDTGLLQSYLVCGCCGNRLAKGKRQNKNWLCQSARYTSETRCNEVRINDEQLKGVLLRAIQNQCRLVDVEIKRIWKAEQKSRSKSDVAVLELKKYQRQISQLQKRKISGYEDLICGRISKEDFLRMKQEASQQEEQIKIQMGLLQTRIMELSEQSKKHSCAASDSEPFLKNRGVSELTPELMKDLVKRVIVHPDGAIRIEWNFNNTLLHPALFESYERAENPA